MATSKVRKRCGKCGWTGLAGQRQRRCYQRTFGKGSYACWGELATVTRPAAAGDTIPTPAGLGIGWQLSEEADMQRNEQYRQRARKKLAAAEKRRDQAQADMWSAARRLQLWTARAARLGKQAAMTDAELDAARERRQSAESARAERKAVRGIRLESAS